jgi:phosphatidate cytidylyltransferase
MGSKPLAPEISPNKTVEGVIGGAVVTIVATVLILGFIPHIHPWDGGKALWLAIIVSIFAPLGDLAESMIKRDLGLKDMGSILPGHGGVLDRFDALLFVLPASYYLLRVIA